MNPLVRAAAPALLALLALLALQAPAAAAPAAAPPSVAAESVAPLVQATTQSGLEISADVHEEYLSGFSMLITLTVRNPGATPVAFPDLVARPHLVRFKLKRGTTLSERYTTPPAVEPTTAWMLAAGAQRKVTLEIPSSAELAAGTWALSIEVHDPKGIVTLPPQTVHLARATPVGGSYVWEAAIQQSVGAMVPWVHKAANGFDLYVMRLDPESPKRVLGQFFLGRLPAQIEPLLSLARSSDALSRYLYWQSGPQSYTLARLQGSSLRSKPRSFSVPYPKFELLGRGSTDARGGVVIPIWVPDPSGTGGSILAICADVHGRQQLRKVVRLPARPTVVATAVDVGSNLVLAVGHPAAIDVYRIDSALPVEIGARGTRATALADGWAPAALAFDSLPDRGDRAGGLALLSVLTRAQSYRSVWTDLAGGLIEESQPLPWTAPGNVLSLLPSAFGPFSYLTQETSGALWYGAQGAVPQKLDGVGPGTLWPSADSVLLRHIVPGTVVADSPVGTRTQ